MAALLVRNTFGTWNNTKARIFQSIATFTDKEVFAFWGLAVTEISAMSSSAASGEYACATRTSEEQSRLLVSFGTHLVFPTQWQGAYSLLCLVVHLVVDVYLE